MRTKNDESANSTIQQTPIFFAGPPELQRRRNNVRALLIHCEAIPRREQKAKAKDEEEGQVK